MPTQLTFSSHGRDIGIEIILPATGGKKPAILVLHGSGGSRDFPQQVQDLAASGYVVLVPHYFESTGTSWADPQSIQRHGITWGETILDALEFARKLPHLDAERIGVLGFSLGGYLAVAVASNDPRIRCVVEFFGGVPEKFLPSLDRLPPILILHGETDRIVPIRHAMRLKQLCEEKKFYFEMEIYPGVGHSFPEALLGTAMERARIFFDQQLQQQNNPRGLAVSVLRA